MARMLGIDVGSATVKVAMYEGGGRRAIFRGAWARPVPQDLERAPDLAAREEALRALLADVLQGEAPPPVTVMGFPTEHASVRMVTLPFADRAQVERALPYEVEGQVPFDLEDVVLISRIIELKAGASRVLTVLADREAVRAQLETLARVDLNPRHLALDADLLGKYSSRGTQAVLDLGHGRTLIGLFRDGHLLGARALTQGGRDLTLALARAFQLSYEDATAWKHAMIVPGRLTALAWDDDERTSPHLGGPAPEPPPRDVERDGPAVLRQALEPLLADLRSTLIALEDSLGLEIDEILTTGGGAELQGLVELLRAELGVVVRPVLGEDEEQDPRLAGGLALALGRRAVEGTRDRELDVRVGEFAFKGDISAYAGYAVYGVLGLGALLLLTLAGWGYRSFQLSHERKGVEEQIASAVLTTWPDGLDPGRLKDPSTALAIATEKSTAEQTEVDTLSSAISDTPPTLNLLRELSEGMPAPGEARVDVTELTITDASVVMKIDTDAFDSASAIETSLKQRPLFSAAQGGDSKKVGDIVRFTVTIPMGGQGASTGEDG